MPIFLVGKDLAMDRIPLGVASLFAMTTAK